MPQPRRQLPPPPLPPPAERQRSAAEIAAAAAAGATAGAAAVAVTPGPPVVAPVAAIPEAAKRAAAAASILTALVAYLTRKRERDMAWLGENLPARPRATPDDVSDVIREEARREREFTRKAAERMTAALPSILAIPNDRQREAAMRGLMAQEERYQAMRTEAMAARAIAATDRQVLRRESPAGAFWQLDPTVIEHTAGCLIMGGKFWPWAVLDRVHPPRHAGCPCRLRGYGEAIAAGLMVPSAVRSVPDAIRAASGVVMEAEVADAAAAEFEPVAEFVEAVGLRVVEALSRPGAGAS